jgi:hypothetical protein
MVNECKGDSTSSIVLGRAANLLALVDLPCLQT